MEKKLKNILEVLSKDHMMVIRGGFTFYETVNDSKKCSTVNSNKNCDTINSAKKDCHAINHAGVCFHQSSHQLCGNQQHNYDLFGDKHQGELFYYLLYLIPGKACL